MSRSGWICNLLLQLVLVVDIESVINALSISNNRSTVYPVSLTLTKIQPHVPSHLSSSTLVDGGKNEEKTIGGKNGENSGYVIISVVSSRSEIIITVDGNEVVHVDGDKRNNTRDLDTAGLYIVILSQFDGTVIMSREYNLHEYSGGVGLPPLLASLSQGRILILGVKTEASLNMGKAVRDLLHKLGSSRAHRLSFRGYLCWVLTSWGPSWGEALTGHPGHRSKRNVASLSTRDNKNNTEIQINAGQKKMDESEEKDDLEHDEIDNLFVKSDMEIEEGLEVDYKLLSHTEYTSPVYLEVVVPLIVKDCWDKRIAKEYERLRRVKNKRRHEKNDKGEMPENKEKQDGKIWKEQQMGSNERDTEEMMIREEVERERERSEFCNKYEGYGLLCDCQSPASLDYPEMKVADSVIEDVPLVIIASHRPQALYRCLVTVLRSEGGTRGRILVVIDGYNTQVVALLHLMKISYLINNMEATQFASTSTRISHNYRFALHSAFLTFSNASRLIVLEEDLLVASDFFSYFNQTSWLLDADPSLYCISAWNDLGALHSARDPHTLRRIESHAGYGWMISKKFFDEIYNQWPSPDKEHDWDVWLRGVDLRAGRECVIPDVSRTYHSGVSGAHIKTVLTQAHFTGHAVTAASTVTLHNVHRLTQVEYEEDIYKILESDNVYFLNNTKHPCSLHYIPKNYTAGPVVVFISMIGPDHYLGWKKMGACLGVWNLDQRSHHRGLFSLNFYNTSLYIIGYPFSDYSYLKPWWVHVVHEPGAGEEFKLGQRTLLNRVNFPVTSLHHHAPYLLTQINTPEPVTDEEWQSFPVF